MSRTVLLAALPHGIGLVLLLAAIGWGLGWSTSREVQAAAGALAVWVGEIATVVTYFAVRYSVLRDPEGFGDAALATVKRRQRLFTVGLSARGGERRGREPVSLPGTPLPDLGEGWR